VNDAISETTGETPQLITFGTNRINGKDQRITESDATHTQTMQVIHRKVELDMKLTKEKAKEYYDRNRRATPKFKTGNNVYIRQERRPTTSDIAETGLCQNRTLSDRKGVTT
jgi:hypothetical protein